MLISSLMLCDFAANQFSLKRPVKLAEASRNEPGELARLVCRAPSFELRPELELSSWLAKSIVIKST